MSDVTLNPNQIDQLVKSVLGRMDIRMPAPPSEKPVQKSQPQYFSRGVFSELNLAVNAAKEAYPVWVGLRLEHRKKIIEKMRARLRECLQWMSEEAVSETGLGRVEDKIKKNLLVIDKTPGPEILTP